MIFIVQQDIVTLATEAIVNSTSTSLMPGNGGIDKHIHIHAGAALKQSCLTLGGCKTGEAKITKGFALQAKYIIHTVGPIWLSDDSDVLYLQNCYSNCLALAQSHNLQSIAFPCISTGMFSFPIDLAAKVALQTVHAYLSENRSSINKVVFCCYTNETYNTYTEQYKTLALPPL